MSHALQKIMGGAALPLREKVQIAEAEMRAHGVPVEIPVRHHFANKGGEHGLYVREITIPAESLVTGEIHKTEQINILLKGKISVSTENGIETLIAPAIVVSPAGTKRIAYTHTDVTWLTFHATRETDLAKIEDTFIAKSEQEWLAYAKALEQKVAA